MRLPLKKEYKLELSYKELPILQTALLDWCEELGNNDLQVWTE